MDMVATVKTLPFKGRITVNGADVVDNTQRVAVNVLDPNVVAFKRMVGYVEQQDIMNGGPPRPRGLNRAVPGLCTVKEALHFCVQLKPPRANPEEVRRLMEHGLNPEDDKDVVEEAYWEQDETGTLVEKRRPEGVLRYAEGGRYRLGQAGALDVIGKKMVCTVMKELGLEKVQDSLIGDEQVRGISGGQKKRVSIARALVSNPYLIFLDEPTSGLSAADAVTLIQQVKSLVDGLGIVAVSVIHQPRNRLFKMFDHLILLTGGRMVYQGPPKIDAKNYFDAVGFPLPQNTNPADHYIDYITESFNKDTPKLIDFFDGESKIVGCKEWVLQQVQKTRDEQAVSLDPSVTEMLAALENQLTTWEKVQVLAGREWTCLPRDQIKFTARIANAIFMGLLLGGIYADIEAKNIAAFAMICVEMPVIQSVASLPCLFRDRAFMHRERDTGLYTTTPFYLVTYLLSIVFSAITVFLQLVLTYGFTSLPWWPYFPMMYITCLTGFFMMDAVLFVIAYTGKDLDSAFLFFNFTLGIFMFSNGFTMNKVTSGDYINWLLYISPIFYSMSTVLNNFVHYGDYGDADEVEMIMTCDSGPGCLGLSGDNVFARNMFIMLALGVSLHAFAFYCARFMHRPQR